ncbi:unnamed protein product [Schistosoma curassoni]|uniref:ZP domain-containing protein n=1 Tax=Schistosoma curassoni TaxID=6186 RepID=A0A183KZX2_9TREM|nr:unnamed protein product [Schistosoma curassoni]
MKFSCHYTLFHDYRHHHQMMMMTSNRKRRYMIYSLVLEVKCEEQGVRVVSFEDR